MYTRITSYGPVRSREPLTLGDAAARAALRDVYGRRTPARAWAQVREDLRNADGSAVHFEVTVCKSLRPTERDSNPGSAVIGRRWVIVYS